MKRITDTPNVSKEMQTIYKKLWDSNGNFKALLPDIDAFLDKYPIYTEALVFKARALMALGRNGDALRCIKIAKRIDKWRLIGRFDEAEIFLEKRKKELSVTMYVDTVKAYATELRDGIDGYLSCCSTEVEDRIKKLTKESLIEFLFNDGQDESFKKLQNSLLEMQDKMEHFATKL